MGLCFVLASFVFVRGFATCFFTSWRLHLAFGQSFTPKTLSACFSSLSLRLTSLSLLPYLFTRSHTMLRLVRAIKRSLLPARPATNDDNSPTTSSQAVIPTTKSAVNTQIPTFLTLPPEIRHRFFVILFGRRKAHLQKDSDRRRSLRRKKRSSQVLRVCHQVRRHASFEFAPAAHERFSSLEIPDAGKVLTAIST